MKKFLLAAIFLLGCDPVPVTKNPWNPPITIHVDIVLNKYQPGECRRAGGTWVVAENTQYLNAFVGCIEPVKETK